MEFEKIRDIFNTEKIGIIGEDSEFKRYAVVIPLVRKDGELKILFEVRAKHLNNQPGEISFPGGKIEEGEEARQAAIRETCEELGTDAENIEIIGQTDIMVTHHNKIIYPYIGIIKDLSRIHPSDSEVDHEFYVPIDFFKATPPLVKRINLMVEPEEELPYLNEGRKVSYRMAHGKSSIYFYRYGEYIIWGLTAKILDHFINRIKDK